MCRIAAYFGPALPLSALLRDSPHSLEDQSRNAREMSGSSVAGDGWGVGWFPEDQRTPPGMIKSILPLWSDENAKTAAHAIRSCSVVGHIRLASPGIEVCFTNTPLYVLGDHLFTMNGELSPWPGPLSRALRARLNGEDEAAVRGSTDAEMFGALWRTCLRRVGQGDMAGALREALRETRELAVAQDGTVRANVIVAGRSGFVGLRYADSGLPGSLYCLSGEERWRGGSLVASEPLDDGPGWQEVKTSTLVHGDKHGLRLEPLNLGSVSRLARRTSA